MREKIASKIVKAIYMDRDSWQPLTDIALDIADRILSLPSGLVAGEHEITVEEALETLNSIINEPRYYFEDGSLLLENSLTNGKWIQCNALTFDGHRITKPIIPQTR